jgi:uncharacterized protein YegP (UPF0339 family)
VRKLSCLLALFVFTAALVTIAAPPAVEAQEKKDKKDDKKDPKKDAKDDKKDVKAPEPGVIEVYQAKDGWRFRVKNAEGKSVAIGTVGYDKKEDALKQIEFLKATFAKGTVSEPKEEKK